jgi:hypothetical protein
MFILLIDVDDDTRFVVFNDLSLHDTWHIDEVDNALEKVTIAANDLWHYFVLALV